MTAYIFPYKNGSRSVKALKEALGIKEILRKGSKFSPKDGDVLINWGSSENPYDAGVAWWVNHPDNVARVTNKLPFFRELKDPVLKMCVPDWTSDKEVVQGWLDKGDTVVARQKLTGHSGEGIEILEKGSEIVDAPLFVKYIPKKSEWRVHLHKIAGEVRPFDVQRKVKSPDVASPVSWKVRNHDNGFIFQRENLVVPEGVMDVASTLFDFFMLDFAAVDVVYNEKHDRAYVLEINTAPGLEGTTLTNYSRMIERFLLLNQ